MDVCQKCGFFLSEMYRHCCKVYGRWLTVCTALHDGDDDLCCGFVYVAMKYTVVQSHRANYINQPKDTLAGQPLKLQRNRAKINNWICR